MAHHKPAFLRHKAGFRAARRRGDGAAGATVVTVEAGVVGDVGTLPGVQHGQQVVGVEAEEVGLPEGDHVVLGRGVAERAVQFIQKELKRWGPIVREVGGES